MKKLNAKIAKRLGKILSVKNMESENVVGRNISNQFIINFKNGTLFQSYETFIAAKINNADGTVDLILDPYHTYSVTTSRWTRNFCNLDREERKNAIKRGYCGRYAKVIEMNLNK